MPYPHEIRLAGPWNLSFTPAGNERPQQRRIKLPCDWNALSEGCIGEARLSRRFGQPTNIDSGERVWLVVEEAGACTRVLLNGDELEKPAPDATVVEMNVTDKLHDRNDLSLEFMSSSDRPLSGPLPNVRLEVRRPWYLKDVAVEATWGNGECQVQVRGQAAGEPFDDAEFALLVEGFDRELCFQPLAERGAFEASVRATQIAENHLVDSASSVLDIQLLRGGEAVWQCRRPV